LSCDGFSKAKRTNLHGKYDYSTGHAVVHVGVQPARRLGAYGVGSDLGRCSLH